MAKKNDARPDFGYTKIEETILKSSEGEYFGAAGAWVHGTLVSIEARELIDQRSGEVREVNHYAIDVSKTPGLEDGTRVLVRETTDLSKKIRPEHVGRRLVIARTADTYPSKIKGNNPMVIWEVEIELDAPAAAMRQAMADL